MAKWILGGNVIGYVPLGDFEGTYQEAMAAARERMTPELLAGQGDDLGWGDAEARLQTQTLEEVAAILAACEAPAANGEGAGDA